MGHYMELTTEGEKYYIATHGITHSSYTFVPTKSLGQSEELFHDS